MNKQFPDMHQLYYFTAKLQDMILMHVTFAESTAGCSATNPQVMLHRDRNPLGDEKSQVKDNNQHREGTLW
jgi:hypothetical protein